MGREATKAGGNVWYEARKAAAKNDTRLQSREGASELLGMSSSAIADAELGLTKFMPVDKAIQMSALYHSPQLLNWYCLNECPIGSKRSITDEVVSIELVTVKLLRLLDPDRLTKLRRELTEIAADGLASKRAIEKLPMVIDYLKELAVVISQMEITVEIALKEPETGK